MRAPEHDPFSFWSGRAILKAAEWAQVRLVIEFANGIITAWATIVPQATQGRDERENQKGKSR